MRYLVTGGAGFIGSNIVKKLVEQGEEVIVLDNLSTGKEKNLLEVINKIQFIKGDLLDKKIVEKAVKDVDYVIHQAALPSVKRSVENPEMSLKNIVNATLNLFIACLNEKSIKRIVQAASSSAYGNTEKLPKIETIYPAPRSVYAASKLTQEFLASAFYYSYGIEIISLRYFNVFGPNQDYNSPYSAVIPKFMDAAINNKEIVIYGDGTITRDFTYVENVVNANLLACKCKWTGAPEVMNIGTGNMISLNDLVKEIEKITNTSLTPKYTTERIGDVKSSLADIDKAKKILGYYPNVDFHEGVKKLYDWKLKNERREI